MGKQQLESGWRKPRRSGTNGNCVEVASADSVMIRDTKDRDGVTLSIPADAWQEFVAGLR
jgi:hypothetical protein